MPGYIGSRISNTLASLTGATGTLDSSVSFANIANDAISGDKVDGGTISNATLASSVVFPSNHVIQVVSQTFTGTSSAGNTTWVDTVITQSITSLAANSRFLVMVTSMTGGNDATPRILLRRTIGATTYDIGNSASQNVTTMGMDARYSGVRTGINFHLSYVDSPSTSASTSINYKIRLRSAENKTVYLGQSEFTTPTDYKVLSSITIMELAA